LTTDRPDVDGIKTHEHRFFFLRKALISCGALTSRVKVCLYRYLLHAIPCYKIMHGKKTKGVPQQAEVYLLYSMRIVRFAAGIKGKIHIIQEWLTEFSTSYFL